MATVQSQESEALWKKATASGDGGCVEVASLGKGIVGMRDSKDRDGGVLRYTTHEFSVFVMGVKEGEFDHLIGY
jgi:Domain of unknown function (DUF397)